MSGVQRRAADLACRVLEAILPASLKPWGLAVRGETAGIEDDRTALAFALGSLFGLLPRAVVARVQARLALLRRGPEHRAKGRGTREVHGTLLDRPRAFGVVCASAAVSLGLIYMAAAGAPARHLAMNAGALMIGTLASAFVETAAMNGRRRFGGAAATMAAAVLATAFWGVEIDGAARWVRLGGLPIQPSLILVPVLVVGFSRFRDVLATAGVVGAAAAMTLQPDRAMAGVLVSSLAVLAIRQSDRRLFLALAASLAGFAVTLVRADTVSVAPFVDRVLPSAFGVHPIIGLAVLLGAALLLAPAAVGWWRDPPGRATYAAFGAVWLAAVVAAAFGHHPTPVVGFGGSAIVGYLLSVSALPRRARAHGADRSRARVRVPEANARPAKEPPLFAGVA